MTDPAIFTESPELDDAIVDTQRWANEDWLHSQFAWLRANAPIRKMQPNGYVPFWSVTKYNDILAVEGNKELFINEPRPILGPAYFEELMRHLTGRKHLVHSLVVMDAPEHMKYRVLTQQWFMRGNLRRLEATIESLATQYVDQMLEHGTHCDFVKDVAIWFPLRVIMSILGVPEEDEPLILKLTQEIFGSSDPDTQRSFDMTGLKDVVDDFDRYFERMTESRRQNPTDDVASVIANAQIDGQPLPADRTNAYYTIIATAGHDTTSSSIAGGLLALLQNPDQMARLRKHLDPLMPTTVNEIIRWVTPVRQFMRTATADCEVAGQAIEEGDSFALWYPSANRDEDIFTDPNAFRVDRDEAKHLAFGHGVHVCLGQHLARMEISAFFKELLKRVQNIELAGEPKFMEAAFVGGLKSLPISYTAA